MFRRCLLLRLRFEPTELSIEALRKKLRDLERKAHAARQHPRRTGGGGNADDVPLPLALLDTEVRLTILLSQQSGNPEAQRESLLRGDAVYEMLESGSAAREMPETSKAALRMGLCTSLRRCALQLKDAETATVWMQRFRGEETTKAETTPVTKAGSAVTNETAGQGTQSLSQWLSSPASTRPHPTSPHGHTAMLDDDDDNEIHNSATSSTASTMSQKLTNPTRSPHPDVEDEAAGDLTPQERTLRSVRRMMFEQSVKGDNPTASNQGTHPHTPHSGSAPSNQQQGRAHQLRQRMMVEDHPMIQSIFRRKPPVGPRWT